MGMRLLWKWKGAAFFKPLTSTPDAAPSLYRGISDLLRGKARADKQGWQQRAADAAAAFFFEMLSLESDSQRDRADATHIQRPPVKSDLGTSSLGARFTLDQ